MPTWRLGKTVILGLHEINYAAFYSDYICAFLNGKIAKFGPVEEVMTRENLKEIYNVEFEILKMLIGLSQQRTLSPPP